MSYSFDKDTGLEQAEMVKGELTLQDLDLRQFLFEIDILIDKGKDSLAETLLRLAKHKLIKTNYVDSENKDCDIGMLRVYLLGYDEDKITYPDIDFDRTLISKKHFPKNYHPKKEIILHSKIKTFEAIEERLRKEGYVYSDGTWLKSTEELMFLILTLESNGFFRRRSFKGKWYNMNDYLVFFEWRYWFELRKELGFDSLLNIQDKDYLSWISEYL